MIRNRRTLLNDHMKSLPNIQMNKMSDRKLQLGNVHEMRFQYIDHNNPILS